MGHCYPVTLLHQFGHSRVKGRVPWFTMVYGIECTTGTRPVTLFYPMNLLFVLDDVTGEVVCVLLQPKTSVSETHQTSRIT